jgi:hypothetical protein
LVVVVGVERAFSDPHWLWPSRTKMHLIVATTFCLQRGQKQKLIIPNIHSNPKTNLLTINRNHVFLG